MKKLKLILTAFALLLGWNGAWADVTDYLNAGNGWTKVTSASGISTDGTCAYVLVASDYNLVVGIPGENSDAQISYQTLSGQPIRQMVWLIEGDTYETGGYALKNLARRGYYLTSVGDNTGAWNLLARATEKNTANTCYQFTFDGSGNLLIQTNGDVYSDNADRYWGDWTPGNHSNGDGLAGNKQSADKVTFALYKKSINASGSDITFLIGNPSFETGNMTGWTAFGDNNTDVPVPTAALVTNKPLTNASGNYVCNFQWWCWSNNPSIPNGISQNIGSLPPGTYRISAVLGAPNGWTVKLYANNETVSSTMTSDYAGANLSVDITLNGSTDLVIKAIVASPVTNWEEVNMRVDNFRLYNLDHYYDALNEAIAYAEENYQLGFETGEYAPYANVDAISYLKAAKDVNQEEYISWSDLQTILSNLTNATWTANASEVNAFRWNIAGYSSEGETKVPTGGFIGSNSDSRISHNPGYNDGLNGLDQHMALMVIQNTNATYGETVGYTMPLKASTVYAFTFKYAGWGECGTPTIQILDNNSAEVKTQALATPAKTGHNNRDAWISASVIFQTSSAGNYKVKFSTSGGRDAFGDLILLKAAPQPVTITAAGYATFSSEYPLDLSGISGGTAYIVANQSSNSSVTLTEINTAVPANTGLLIKCLGGGTVTIPVASSGEAPATNYLIASDGTEVGINNYVFAYENGEEGTTLYANPGFYKLESAVTVSKGKAYLSSGVIPPGAKANYLSFKGTATEVVAPEVAETEEDEVLYNMAGIQVDKNFKGFVINQKGVKRFNR